MAKSRKHMLLIAYPAFGHIIPLLELGKKIAKRHHVTFAVSAAYVTIMAKREISSAGGVSVLGIEDGVFEKERNENFGDGTDTAMMLANICRGVRGVILRVPKPHDHVPTKSGVRPVDVVIGDIVLCGPLMTCHERGIPFHLFNTGSLSLTLGSLLITEKTQTLSNTRENNMSFFNIPMSSSAAVPPVSVWVKKMMLSLGTALPLVSSIIQNSNRQIDKCAFDVLQDFRVMAGIPVHFVGPLMPERTNILFEPSGEPGLEKRVRGWLDKQANQSVIYVSFGTLVFLPPTQTNELIKAVLRLRRPFIISLALSHQKDLPPAITSKMPSQFEQGNFLILPWTPQKMILQHPATSVFLSHCGWNSTMESVYSGVPVVAWPMCGDQKMNAEWLVQQGMAVIVKGTHVTAKDIIPADSIFSVIRSVIGSGKLSENTCRSAAQAWRQALLPGDCLLSDLISSL